MESGIYSSYSVQEGWWFTSDFGLRLPKSCAQSKQSQDVEIHFVSLVCDYRTKGCILPHPDRPGTQEVPQVRFLGQSLLTPCSSVGLALAP